MVRKTRPRRLVAAATLLLALVLPLICTAAEITGRCIRVADGDTITVLTPANRQIRVRLACIDCPERGYP